jgi:hypothetical protein
MKLRCVAPVVRLSFAALVIGLPVTVALCSPVKVDTNEYKYKRMQHASNDDEHSRGMPKDTTNLVV